MKIPTLFLILCSVVLPNLLLAEKKVFEVLADTRIQISALKYKEDFEVIKEINENYILQSSTDWIGKGSYIIILKKPVDIEAWKEYYKKWGSLEKCWGYE